MFYKHRTYLSLYKSPPLSHTLDSRLLAPARPQSHSARECLPTNIPHAHISRFTTFELIPTFVAFQ